jgi:hypothetical protein
VVNTVYGLVWHKPKYKCRGDSNGNRNLKETGKIKCIPREVNAVNEAIIQEQE